MAEKVSRDGGYRSDTIAISRDMGSLRGTAEVVAIAVLAAPQFRHKSLYKRAEKMTASCCRCLRFLVLEPQTDHAESCEIMADHTKSCP